MKPNYRRETPKLVEKLGLEKYQFCSMFGISENTYKNWLSGNSSPSTPQFERLKQLVNNQVTPQIHAPPDENNDPKILRGRIVQLSEQLDLLQKTVHVLNADYERRLAESEKKIRELSETVGTTLEQLSSHPTRQKKAG